MLYFLVIPPCVETEEWLVAGATVSPSCPGLMEFALGRAADTWCVTVLSEATRKNTTQHLFHLRVSILVERLPKQSPERGGSFLEISSESVVCQSAQAVSMWSALSPVFVMRHAETSGGYSA